MLSVIENKERILVDALRALGPGWHDRPAIAGRLGKTKLSAVEVATLDLLSSQGKIEQSTMATNRPHILRSVYRLKE